MMDMMDAQRGPLVDFRLSETAPPCLRSYLRELPGDPECMIYLRRYITLCLPGAITTQSRAGNRFSGVGSLEDHLSRRNLVCYDAFFESRR